VGAPVDCYETSKIVRQLLSFRGLRREGGEPALQELSRRELVLKKTIFSIGI
jgi:hypothetical protein